MNVLFSQLKKYLSDLKATWKEVANVYTITGYMIDKTFPVTYQGKDDILMDLEVRQNRADSFGVRGLARELSAYYNIPLNFPRYDLATLKISNYKLQIDVKATEQVKRIMAVKLSNIKVSSSPVWLKEYLELYGINSINNLVDLTNYVMIETAHPSHAFDTKKMGDDKLVWEINPKYKKFTTLAGDDLELSTNALVISDGTRPLSLCMIGGKEVAIDKNTNEIVLEMAIYDGGHVRRNSRDMKIMTEAGSRLEKYLDPDSIPEAFAMLVSMILEECGGEITSEIYDNYLQPSPHANIKVDLDKVQQIAGIPITYSESKDYLEKLGFEITSDNKNLIEVKRPKDRLDIEMEEDVFEEIIRMKGFDKIPKDRLILNVNKNITPKHLDLIDSLNEAMIGMGYDEVRSWVLVNEQMNQKTNFEDWNELKVTNSINDEVPILRQSLGAGLFTQVDTYLRNNITDISIFEIGKVFGSKEKGKYEEHYAIGILNLEKNIETLKLDAERLLRSAGIDNISYEISRIIPKSAHPMTCWDIIANNQTIGIIYKSNNTQVSECNYAEIDIDKLDSLVGKNNNDATQEIVQKIVVLDNNIELAKDENILRHIKDMLHKSDSKIWKWEVIDMYDSEGKVRYTIRVSYTAMTDPEAKELNAKIFGNK